ncbi:AraC family transcriptional regulator [Rhodobacteraceae bacterium KMM 6894]|nr:AraC family transcriptional regulator [Rhodobacteraceae bacterium KMM 6894]
MQAKATLKPFAGKYVILILRPAKRIVKNGNTDWIGLMIGLYHRYQPPAQLARYVQAFYVADTPDLDIDVVSPPTGYPLLGLIWHGFGGAEVEGQSLDFGKGRIRHFSGQLDRKHAVVRWRGGIGHAVAEFRATGFYELFGMSGQMLVNTTRAVQDVHPAFDRSLAAAQSGCVVPADYLTALQDALVGQTEEACETPSYLHDAIHMIEAADGAIRLSDVIAACGARERSFHTLFTSVVGLTPKYFCRIVQFNHVGRLILSGAGSQLAGLAAEAGFYDQAHFTRAFKEFAEQSPQAFLESDETNLSTFIRQNHINTKT